ncbi:DNA replication ATP-dependent helicase/nuclease DNA2 [Phlebotomus argentipes]|uniref:DNA replication ATP-dependent helicase/nuclease DNA2 n=1 Tax=Phlebotomus argentipes TaxID=94469 RepID=UPI002892BC11|nr:DNA replication ATP-dependent helicase/nuclease DNA2 [Phlebotomus argentipes]
MDSGQKRLKVAKESDEVSLDFSNWLWDEWDYEEPNEANKENISVNTGTNNIEPPARSHHRDRTFDLTRWRRCEVKSVTRLDREVRLSLMEDDVPPERAQTGQLILHDMWVHTEVNPLDVVSVKAVWSEELQCHIITMTEGLLVVNPNVLVSGTTLLGSLFCSRRGILSEYFKTLVLTPEIMTVGSLVHELLQMCLERNLKTHDEIQWASQELLQQRGTFFQIYSSTLAEYQAQGEITPFIPKIEDFFRCYLPNSHQGRHQGHWFLKWGNFEGSIASVEDIEENIWMPQLGLKGKVDVTARVRKRTADGGEIVKIMPVEVKTGRASFSAEHRGQLTLYQMMMSELLGGIDSGLLLYLREGVFKEMQPSWNEMRDLIMMRNKYVSFLACEKIYLDEGEAEFKLPEPINHPTGCLSCPMKTICGSFLLRSEQRSLVTPDHHFHRTLISSTEHLSEKHVDYFIDWVHIVLYEEFHEHENFGQERIWLRTPEVRESEGFTLAYLMITNPPTLQSGRYLTDFHVDKSKPRGDKRDCLTAGFSVGDYLVVSTSKRIAVATGIVQTIDCEHICLSLERNLMIQYSLENFHIDRYISNTQLTFNLTNLGAMLENTERSNKLRRLIVDKVMPRNESCPKDANEDHVALRNLNSDQVSAVIKSVQMVEYMLLQGFPGTGKTQTIVALVRYYISKGMSVLITSHTNAAVNNLLERLLPHNLNFMRLGSVGRISPALQEHTESHLTRHCTTYHQLQRVYDDCPIVGVTCMGCTHPMLIRRVFDICIVDEATQVFQPTILRPLMAAKKFLLVGDPHQLPPLMKSEQAIELGGGESLFRRLQTKHTVATLRKQYRMNQTITDVANKISYKGFLTCANETVANNVLQYNPAVDFSEEKSPFPWLYRVLRSDLEYSFVYIDTGDTARLHAEFTEQMNISSGSKVESDFLLDSPHHVGENVCEAALCLYVVRALLELGVNAKDIGIITPFRAQVALLQQLMAKYNEMFSLGCDGVEVNTVDQYQGREKSVIIYSCVSNCNKKGHACVVDKTIMGSSERFAVAVTRAKQKCIVMGNSTSLDFIEPFAKLKRGITPKSNFKLTDKTSGFDWQVVQKHLLDIHRKNPEIVKQRIF